MRPWCLLPFQPRSLGHSADRESAASIEMPQLERDQLERDHDQGGPARKGRRTHPALGVSPPRSRPACRAFSRTFART